MEIPLPPLKKIRKSLHLSQEDVAKYLQLKATTYSKIERGDIQLTVPRLYELAGVFKMPPEDILLYDSKGNGAAMWKENITYVPVHVQADFLNDYISQEKMEGCIAFSLPVFIEKNLFMIDMEGDGMYPTFSNGDYLIIKNVANHNFIKWGEPYVVVSTEERVFNRLDKHKDKGMIMLTSDNELYPPYEIPRQSIKSLWHVKGVVSKNLAPKNFLERRVQLLENNVNTMIRRT
jgi:transcriptional regulator with XRE-family HTH domain